MHPRFRSAFADLTPALQHALLPILSARDFAGAIQPDQVRLLKQQCQLDEHQLALALLPLAAACALTPISDFNVGAVAQGVSGTLWFGANMEFAGAPLQQTVHAEQSAVTHAWLGGEHRLLSVTVNYTPCGHCRQFMNELNCADTLLIALPQQHAAPLASYLPHAFGPRDLGITTLLMDSSHRGFNTSTDPLEQAAIEAASRSHAPYSNACSGVALQTIDGTIFSGRYAENAAFNPSLPPLQAALIALNMAGYALADIHQAVLAENPAARFSQQAATAATLAAAGCRALRRIPLSGGA